ncbi:cardiolipin synthase [Cohnella fermenti]|uniref:Cardiolipin synthase n=1 Tax=Cohnella fermenti TaxID=2565925 RepID=A0A4S4BJ96_9BACL|nr:cardiolipin synthase [Cohnella fermenti]THF74715.1 cardiolipin synthase [Cohnella fermenti]
MAWIVVILLLILFQAATVLALEHRRPAHAVAWLFILLVVPVVGFALYYFLAREYRRQRKARRSLTVEGRVQEGRLELGRIGGKPSDIQNPQWSDQNRLFRALVRAGSAPILLRNRCEVLTNAAATYESMLEAIRQAKRTIHIASYIVRDDTTGRLFRQELVDQARKGVKVRLLYDGIGSHKLTEKYLRPLREAGVSIACFFPLKPSFLRKRINYRNHRKILVTDGIQGFVGGINIGDEYLGGDPRLGFWRDTHLKLEGDSVYSLQEIFLKDWEIASGGEPIEEPGLFPEHNCSGEEAVQIVAGGPDSHGDTIHDTLFAAIAAAKSRIWVTTPYFIPSPGIRTALKSAARSGLDVRMIIPYVPDTWLVHASTLSFMEEMLAAGIRVWRYDTGFVHAKVIIVDELLAILGTANMDLRSFYSNFETNAILFHPSAIARLEEDFRRDEADGTEMELESFRRRSVARRLGESISRMLSPLL